MEKEIKNSVKMKQKASRHSTSRVIQDNTLDADHPHVSRNPDIFSGAPIVSGVRFTVSDVLGYLATSHDIASICKTWQLSKEAVRDAIAYAQDVYDAVIYPTTQDTESSEASNSPELSQPSSSESVSSPRPAQERCIASAARNQSET